ncbi:MAG: hypothetical protein P8Y24_07165 [Gammaproteobacteria bacterium]
MDGGAGGIILWIIGCIFAMILQRRTFIEQPKEYSDAYSILILFIFSYVIIFLISLIIPSSLLDYNWYRAFWIIFSPLFFGFIVIKGYVWKKGLMTVQSIKITSQNISRALLLITYTFPFTQIIKSILYLSAEAWAYKLNL